MMNDDESWLIGPLMIIHYQWLMTWFIIKLYEPQWSSFSNYSSFATLNNYSALVNQHLLCDGGIRHCPRHGAFAQVRDVQIIRDARTGGLAKTVPGWATPTGRHPWIHGLMRCHNKIWLEYLSIIGEIWRMKLLGMYIIILYIYTYKYLGTNHQQVDSYPVDDEVILGCLNMDMGIPPSFDTHLGSLVLTQQWDTLQPSPCFPAKALHSSDLR